MTSPDVFELQRLLKIAKKEWCEIAVIETASHGIKMNRIWWINYDLIALTNISQDHLDLHKTMEDYVNTKLRIFKNLITYKRKPWIKKTAVINIDSEYSDLFIAETYDSLFTYWNSSNANLKARNIKNNLDGMEFEVDAAGWDIKITTLLRWNFNIENILAAIGIFISFWIKWATIAEILKDVSWIPGRMEEIPNNEWFKIFVDYAHTPDALEKVLEDFRWISWIKNIITVFGATWDRDKTKRPVMWEIVSRLSDKVVLTQDDDYSEKSEEIIKDVLPGIERKEWEDFWIIPDRKEAIRTALVSANKNDIVLIAWKWDEHIMVTNKWPIEWHDKTIVEQILKGIDDNKIM
jgi:UDP-N-acetylmuramoyl-L-alanyl-D-glutamate--2,6-diaminopimelate ligase